MRPFAATVFLTLAACPAGQTPNPQPLGRFYFPTGVAHVDSPGSPEGVLFVANANFDKRFESGTVMAIDLAKVGLPPLGAPVGSTGPVQVGELRASVAGVVEVSSFTGELAVLRLGADRVRLFVPSRSEGMHLQAIDATLAASATTSTALVCHTPEGRDDRDCATNAPSLVPREFEFSATGLPRAPAPYGVAVRVRACAADADCGGGNVCAAGQCRYTAPDEPLADVFVTHLSLADSPTGSCALVSTCVNYHAYLARLASRNPTVTENTFFDLGLGANASNSVVAGSRWLYLTGRYNGNTSSENLLRMIDPSGVIYRSSLELAYRVSDARGVALSSDEKRVFIAGRAPDSLVVASIADPLASVPRVQIERALPLPAGPNEMVVIPRPGRGDLVAVVSISAGTLVIYDDDVGAIVALVPGLGLQPYGVTFGLLGAGARLFVSNFGDGRVAVVDIADLARPDEARVVAHLGAQQLCLTQSQSAVACDGGAP